MSPFEHGASPKDTGITLVQSRHDRLFLRRRSAFLRTRCTYLEMLDNRALYSKSITIRNGWDLVTFLSACPILSCIALEEVRLEYGTFRKAFDLLSEAPKLQLLHFANLRETPQDAHRMVCFDAPGSTDYPWTVPPAGSTKLTRSGADVHLPIIYTLPQGHPVLQSEAYIQYRKDKAMMYGPPLRGTVRSQ